MASVRNAFNCSFVACRKNLRKCWHFILCYKPPIISTATKSTSNEYQILCLGLSGSGKSTILAKLVDEPLNNEIIRPTMGFNIKTLPLNDCIVNIKELGGSERLQQFWSNYYNNQINALLFIINLASTDIILDKSIKLLKNLLTNKNLIYCNTTNDQNENLNDNNNNNNNIDNNEPIPIMIIGTHKDHFEARTEQQLKQFIQPILTGYRWRLFCCSAFDRCAIIDAINSLILLIKNVIP